MALDIAIIGCGGIGGYYGARLAQNADYNVHFLLNSEYEHVKNNGLIVDSYLGDFSIKNPKVYNNIGSMPKCDLVCIATKATANDNIFPTLSPVLKKGGKILLLQNGFGGEQVLSRLYPQQHILGGLCFICTFRTAPGHIKHTEYGQLTLAPLNVKDTVELGELADIFCSVGVDTVANPDIMEARWRKLMWNIPYNGLSVVMDYKTDKLTTGPTAKLVRAMMEEVLEAAAMCEVYIEEEFVDAMIKSTAKMKPYEPSMRLDYLAKRELEIEAIYSNVIEYAANYHNQPTGLGMYHQHVVVQGMVAGYDMKYAKMLQWQLQEVQSQYLNKESK